MNIQRLLPWIVLVAGVGGMGLGLATARSGGSTPVILPWMILAVGILNAGIGCVTWRSGGGKNLTLSGAILVAWGASLFLEDSSSGMRYASLAVLAVLVITSVGQPTAWRLLGVRLITAVTGILIASILVTEIFATTKAARGEVTREAQPGRLS